MQFLYKFYQLLLLPLIIIGWIVQEQIVPIEMQQKDKKGDFSIKSTFESWLDVQGEDSVVFLLGNTAVGKSTLCQLVKKVIDHDPNPNLKLVCKKKDYQYQCEGEINPKSIKPLTIYPKKYHIKSKNITIVEVPSRIYSLEKKRPFLDRLLNTVGMAYAARKGSFLFAIDAKNTSGKCEPWKRTFQTVFDSFDLQLLNESMFQSIGFVVISKSASNDFEREVYLNRVQDLYKLFSEQKRREEYSALLKKIQQEKNLSVFRKTTENEESTGKDIKEIFELMVKLNDRAIPLEKQQPQGKRVVNIQPVVLNQEEENLFDRYNQTLDVILDFFRYFFKILFGTFEELVDIRELRLEKGQSKENQHYLKTLQPGIWRSQLRQRRVILQRLSQLRRKSSQNQLFYQHIFGKASLIIEYREKIDKQEQGKYNTLNSFLQLLAEHGLIQQECPQLPELESLYLQLIQYSMFEQRFGPIIKNIDYKKMLNYKNVTKQFDQTHRQAIKYKINLDFTQGKISLNLTPETSKRYTEILDKLFPQNELKGEYQQSIPELKKSLVAVEYDFSDPIKASVQIQKLFQKHIDQDKVIENILCSKDKSSPQIKKQIEIMNDLAVKVAKVLQILERPDLCVDILRDAGKFYSALKCYRQILKGSKLQRPKDPQEVKQMIDGYLDTLMSLDLYQKALEECYQLGQMYTSLLSAINEKRKQIKKKRYAVFDQQDQKKIQQQFLGKQLNLSGLYSNRELLQRVRGRLREIVQESRK